MLKLCYIIPQALLGDVEDSNDSDSVNEEMEVTWEHGMNLDMKS